MHWYDGRESLLDPLLGRDRIGLFTDMDGTISPIVAHADLAKITDKARAALVNLSQLLTIVGVISGRGVADLVQKVGLPALVYVGNHGLEYSHNGRVSILGNADGFRPQLETVIAELQPHLEEGVWLEDKQTTLTLHYRQTLDPQSALERLVPLVQNCAQAQGLRVSQGKMAIEIKPNIRVDKGSTLRSLIEEYRLDGTVYLGDDTTDIDALTVCKQLRDSGACWAVGIGVESAEMPPGLRSSADLLANSVKDVEAFLEWFATERRRLVRPTP